MSLHTLIENFTHAPTLFFFLGMLAVLAKSDLEIPPQIGTFLSLYLLFHIGIKGGEELAHSGFTSSVLTVMAFCVLASFLVPFLMHGVLKRKLNVYDAGAVAATYGSISAVTFATASAFLNNAKVPFGGYMVAGMALMESPAIIAGLILIRRNAESNEEEQGHGQWKKIITESLFNGSVFLLVGSVIIGYIIGGSAEEQALSPFISDIFTGILCLYMLDMGILAAQRIKELKRAGTYLVAFALLFPPIMGTAAVFICKMLGYSPGDALLQTVLVASASYIAVPAAMRIAEPRANMSILLPMSLGVTFSFNITLGIPMYFSLIQYLF